MTPQPNKCVFCGLDDAKFGQGELIRFKTNLIAAPLPPWFSEYQASKSTSSPRSTRRTPEAIATFPNFILSTTDFNVGPHTCLDTFKAIKYGKIFGINGKPCIHGMPNPFFDLEGRPFGLAEDLAKIGWPKPPSDGHHQKLDLRNLIVRCTPREGGEGGWIYAHHCCLSWSDGVKMNSESEFDGVEEVAAISLSRICSFCSKYGASISCRYDGCGHSFHFPCAAAAGCLQELDQLILLCPKHISEAEVCSFRVQPCLMCEAVGNVTEMIFCTGCGSHFHNTCLEPAPILNPTVRVGWQCPDCKACLICRESKDEEKMLVCDVCDKGFHTYCLKPPLTSLPKNGFKCEHCRVCLDCGLTASIANSALTLETNNSSNSITPAAQIKWHNNFTLCDKCLNTRKRAYGSCPVCERAWRCSLPGPSTGQTCVWPGIKCTKCKRMVHCECDPIQSQYPSVSDDPNQQYVCFCCRGRNGSATPSDVASLRAGTSPLHSFCAGSSSCGGDIDTVSVPGDENSNLTIPIAPPEFAGSEYPSMLTLSVKQSPSIVPGDPSPALTVSSPVGKSSRSKSSTGSIRASRNNAKPDPDQNLNVGSRKRSSNNENTLNSGPSAPKQTTQQKIQKSLSSSNIKKTSNSGTSSVATIPISSIAAQQPITTTNSSSLARNRRNKNRKNTMPSFQKKRACKKKSSDKSSFLPPLFSIVRQIHPKVNWVLQGGSNNLANADSQNSSNKADERDDHPTTIVLCRSSDNFVLGQDMCVACGSFGLDDSFLLSCAQCGQCYHPFCADVPRVTQTMLERGWRCLDCTACEGCGRTSDENLLLLCDDCDISYHTFCLDPPLTQVPKAQKHRLIPIHRSHGGPPKQCRLEGGWKCSHCVVCLCCGRRDPGAGCKWHANYTLCGPCSSMSACPVCALNYKDSELLVRCSLCQQWLHAACDQIKTEEELDLVTDLGYNCSLCRDRGAKLGAGQILLMNKHEANGSSELMASWKQDIDSDDIFPDKITVSGDKRYDEPFTYNIDTTKLFFMDGIVLTQYGVKTVRQQSLKQPPRKTPGSNQNSESPANTIKKSAAITGSQTPHVEDESSQLSAPGDPTGPLSILDPNQQSSQGSLLPPVTPLATSASDTGPKSPSSVATHSDDDTQSGSHKATSNKQNGSKVKAKRTMNLGLGGFRAKPAKTAINKRQQLAAAASSSLTGQVILGAQACAVVLPGGTVPSKRRQNSKKKSELEEHYPEYLMNAFLGENYAIKSGRTVSGSSLSDTGSIDGGTLSPNNSFAIKTMSTEEINKMLAARDSASQSRLSNFIENLERLDDTTETSTASTAVANWSHEPSGSSSQVDSSGLSVMARQLMDQLLEIDTARPSDNQPNLKLAGLSPTDSSAQPNDSSRSPHSGAENWSNLIDDCLINLGELDESLPEPTTMSIGPEQNVGLLRPEIQPSQQKSLIPVGNKPVAAAGQNPFYRPPHQTNVAGFVKSGQISQPNTQHSLMKIAPQHRPLSSKQTLVSGQMVTSHGNSLLPELSLSDIEKQLGNMDDIASTTQDLFQTAFCNSVQRPNQVVKPSQPISENVQTVANLVTSETIQPPVPSNLGQMPVSQPQKPIETSHGIPPTVSYQNSELRQQQPVSFVATSTPDNTPVAPPPPPYPAGRSPGTFGMLSIQQSSPCTDTSTQPSQLLNSPCSAPNTPLHPTSTITQQQQRNMTPNVLSPGSNMQWRSPNHQQQFFGSSGTHQMRPIVQTRDGMTGPQASYSQAQAPMRNYPNQSVIPRPNNGSSNGLMVPGPNGQRGFSPAAQQNAYMSDGSQTGPGGMLMMENPQQQMFLGSPMISGSGHALSQSGPMSGTVSMTAPINANPIPEEPAIQGGNKRINYKKWAEDEQLGSNASIACILYANVGVPDLKINFPDFTQRAKEIQKIWRRLSVDDRNKWVVSNL